MQMRRCAVWVSVLALFAFASPALAAPKGKKHRKDKEAAAADSGETTAAPVEKEKPKDVDDLMSDSTKKKPATAKAAEPDEPPAKAADDVGEPDAWERPPAEDEKPKKKKFEAVPEEKKGDGRNMDVGVYLGYGISFNGNFPGGAGNPYGLGGGLQGTYALDSHIVFGLGAEMYLGTSATMYYYRYLHIHALVGYDFWFGKFLLRPSLWLGASLGMTNNLPVYLSGIQTSLVWGLGLALHYLLGDNGWYLGADIHLTFVTGSKATNGMPILLTLGKRF